MTLNDETIQMLVIKYFFTLLWRNTYSAIPVELQKKSSFLGKNQKMLDNLQN